MSWEVVIGLEIHTQLATHSKIFSGASTTYGAEPNTQACAVDLGLPGVLPVLNGEVVRMAAMFGLAVNATVAPRSVFALTRAERSWVGSDVSAQLQSLLRQRGRERLSLRKEAVEQLRSAVGEQVAFLDDRAFLDQLNRAADAVVGGADGALQFGFGGGRGDDVACRSGE